MSVTEVTAATRANSAHKTQITDYLNNEIIPYLSDQGFPKDERQARYMRNVNKHPVTLQDEVLDKETGTTFYQLQINGEKKTKTVTLAIRTFSYSDHEKSSGPGLQGRYFIFPNKTTAEAKNAIISQDQALRESASSGSSREVTPENGADSRPSFVAANREKVQGALSQLFERASQDQPGADAVITSPVFGGSK